MTTMLLLSFLSWTLFLAVTTLSTATYIRPSDLPQNGKWMSLNENVEYLPVLNDYYTWNRHLEQEDGTTTATSSAAAADTFYSFQPFVDGEAEYDEYQQAWRYLGFMIDCNDGTTGNDDDGSWDGGTGEGCHRYLLWAAYVDLNYQGGGIGEYQYWDLQKQQWNTNPCNYVENSRCAKMDCHLENTHWSLLGLFKHRSYDDWMEQLFKHEGYCVWNYGQYQFMSNARKTWPQGCEAYELQDGSYIYYDLRPLSGGKMDIGLYTDTRCMEAYQGTLTVQDLLGNILVDGGSGDGGGGSHDQQQVDDDMYEPSSLAESLKLWDSSFDTWRICQPCVAYDLNNVGYNADDDASRGSAYNTYTYGYDDDQGNNYEQTDFDCYDDADYTNVNQCMKFMAKTEMNAFTFRDISLASTQGTLVEYVPLAGYTNHTTRSAWSKFVSNTFFIVSMVVLVTGVYMAYKARRELKKLPILSQEPLFTRNDNAELT